MREDGSILKTLQEMALNFNKNILVSHTGGQLSSDGGLTLCVELMAKFQFTILADKLLRFNDQRRYCQHSNSSILKQLILQIIAGYSADSAATFLEKEPLFKLLLDKPSLASQATISRFWQRFDKDSVSTLQTLNEALIDRVRLLTNQTATIIDIDSTHSDTYGKQEATNYNAHYGTEGYHPLLATDQDGNLLKAVLRPGNAYTSKDVKAFLTPLLKHYQTQLPTTDILVRGDSGFATPEVYDVCEANDVFYIIRLKRNRKLQNLAEKFVKISDQTQWQEEETHYYSEIYQSASWPKPRQIYIKSTRVAGELIFSHEFIVTNLTNLTAETAFELYHKRGQMENYIKEAKTGFFFDKTDSSTFNANAARMMVSVLAYNIVNFLKQLALTKHDSGLCVSTLRIRLFKVAARVVHTGRRIQLRLSSYHVYHRLFYQALQRIQAIE